MKEVYEQFRELNSEIVAVSFATPEFVAAFSKEYRLPFPLASDPERRGYQTFGLDKTTWKDMLRPKVIANYLRLMVRGWLPWKSRKGDDLFQLGGDFVLDTRRRITYAYRSAEPTDRPPVKELLDAVKAANASVTA